MSSRMHVDCFMQTRAKDRREMLAALEAGELDILVGTHAVISADVRFRSLALAVVDEQHKCGRCLHCACSVQQADSTQITSGAMKMVGAELLNSACACRFGVEQRAMLQLKSNPSPHVLSMTATPIPRTLSLVR